MNIGVIGCGYVGLVSATGFAELGHNVVAVKSEAARLKFLQMGRSPFHDPYLPELVRKYTGAMWTQDTVSPLGSATQRLVVPIR